MNTIILSQWEKEIETRFPCLNGWQVANMALMSYGVIKAEGSQPQKVGRKMRLPEKVESASRRIRRFRPETDRS